MVACIQQSLIHFLLSSMLVTKFTNIPETQTHLYTQKRQTKFSNQTELGSEWYPTKAVRQTNKATYLPPGPVRRKSTSQCISCLWTSHLHMIKHIQCSLVNHTFSGKWKHMACYLFEQQPPASQKISVLESWVCPG